MDNLTRAKRLHILMTRIVALTAFHIDAGNYDRVHALDERFLPIEDALTEAQESLTPTEADEYGIFVFGAQAWAERPWAHADPDDVPPVIEPRKHADGVGFTPFAYRHLLHDTGYSADHAVRPFIFGASKPKRVRIETRATLTLAFQFYTGREDVTHLWVQWSDGKRHLVHRKGC